MSSKQKRNQARRNGAKAAGTKSPEGIKKSSMNALRHGLTSKALVLTNESQSQFDELQQSYILRFQPEDNVEMDLVDQMVAAQWRLRRIWCMQTAALDLKMDRQEEEIAKTFTHIDQATRTTVAFTTLANEEKCLETLLRYETQFTRMYQRALNILLRLQREIPKLRNDPKPGTDPEIESEMTPSSGPELPDMTNDVSNNEPESRPDSDFQALLALNAPPLSPW